MNVVTTIEPRQIEGPNLDRLRKIKGKYDPQNVFRQNVNITPEKT